MSVAFQSSHDDRLLVPLMVGLYPSVAADAVKAFGPRNVLERAAGTGILTQELAKILPPGTAITATDLNQPMIDHAKQTVGMERVIWRQADAMKLPFQNETWLNST